MAMNEMVLLKPAFKDYLWGGTKLRSEYGKECSYDRIAESWELSAHKDGESTVSSGEFKGLSLSEYIERCGREILGSRGMEFERFPILIKLIDAKDNLSIQVHPSDSYALKNEGEYGKTEVWYVLSAEEGASLYYGFCKTISRSEYKERIENNTITEVLNRVEAKAGDVFFIDPGTVHAIGKGLLICEIQQNSNTTYRVYDYDRRDKNGNPRELHIEKAMEVSDLNKKPLPERKANKEGVFAKCKYFTSEYIKAAPSAAIALDCESFRSATIIEGEANLTLGGQTLNVKKGDTVFIPAQNGSLQINGNCSLILSYV